MLRVTRERSPKVRSTARRILPLGAGLLAAGVVSALAVPGGAEQATAAPTGFNVYFGTTHSHTGTGSNHGADNSGPREVFAGARRAGFDWWVLTEHTGYSGPVDQPGFYSAAKRAAAEFTDAGFVGLAGYEYTENSGNDGDSDSGHMTGLNTAAMIDDYKCVNRDTRYNARCDSGWNYRMFLNYLASQRAQQQAAGQPVGNWALGGFNHPPKGGHDASHPSLLTEASRGAIVMSEILNTRKSESNYPGFLRELERGWRVAPTCGRDNHRVDDNIRVDCVTGLLAPRLDRASVVEALINRSIYTSRDHNLQVQYTAAGKVMGSRIGRLTSVPFNIAVRDPDTGNARDKIRRIEILTTGGRVAAARNFDSHSVNWQVTVPAGANKWFFVRVLNGEGHDHTAIAAPVWLWPTEGAWRAGP